MRAEQIIIACCWALSCLYGPAAAAQSGPSGTFVPFTTEARPSADPSERRVLIRAIVNRWGPYVQATTGEKVGNWASRLVPAFRHADTNQLRRASEAGTFQDMLNAMLGQKSASTRFLPGRIVPKQLGSTVGDLVFTPVRACNLVDTRKAGGAFAAAGSQRHFNISGPNVAAQGGSEYGCTIPANPPALLLGITAVEAPNRGFLKIWPYNEPQPLASSMSYGPSQNSRNDVVVRMSQGLWYDFSMVANKAGANVVVTVLGAFMAPEVNRPVCDTARDSILTIPANSNALYYPASTCAPATLGSAVAPYCRNLGSSGVYSGGSGIDEQGAFCHWINTSAFPQTVEQGVRCCWTPGR